MHLTQLPRHQRPREKLAQVGPSNLQPVELIALLLGTGSKQHSVLELAQLVLKKTSRKALSQLDPETFMSIPGVGHAQATRLLAALELGRRLYQPSTRKEILTQEDAYQELREIGGRAREYLVALYLNGRHQLIHKEVISVGSLNVNQVEIRDLFTPAFLIPSTGIILGHNHPSGETTPSDDDIYLTRRIEAAGELLGITLIDHLIITQSSWQSIRSLLLSNPPPGS